MSRTREAQRRPVHEGGQEPHAQSLERLKRELRGNVDSIDLLFSL